MNDPREESSVHSTIRTNLLNSVLKRGSLLASMGALLIILGGTLLPLALLKTWGIPLFCLGLTCIAWGQLPYRKLATLQLKPHAIHCNGHDLLFLKNGKPLFKIALNSLEKMAYLEKKRGYGLAIWLKRPITEKVRVLQPRFNYLAFTKKSRKDFEGCDLFLPYFSKHAAEQFTSCVKF